MLKYLIRHSEDNQAPSSLYVNIDWIYPNYENWASQV